MVHCVLKFRAALLAVPLFAKVYSCTAGCVTACSKGLLSQVAILAAHLPLVAEAVVVAECCM